MQTEFPRKIDRSRFILCSNLPENRATDFADFLDGFMNFFEKNLGPIKPDKDFRIFVFESEQQLADQLSKTGGEAKLGAYYDIAHNALFTHSEAGMEFLLHELTRKILEQYPFIDPWASEGIPTLFQRLFAYRDNKDLYLRIGVQNPLVINKLGATVTKLSLVETIAQQWPTQTIAEERLAAIFLYRQGKLKKFMELSQSGGLDDYPTIFEAACAQFAPKMENDWKRYLEQIYKNRDLFSKLPSGEFAKSKQDFARFVLDHDLDVLAPEVHQK